jgi:hypothetical protein
VASIEKRLRDSEVRWYARFRDPAGAQKVKVFTRRIDASDSSPQLKRPS